MRKIKTSLSILVLLLVVSCYSEFENLETNSLENEIRKESVSEKSNGNGISREYAESQASIFEENMQVLSFAVAHVVLHHNDARAEVENALNPSNYVSVEALLSAVNDDVQSPFRTAFRNFLVLNYFDGGRPGGSTQRPGNNNVPPPTGIMESSNMLYELFVQYIRDEQCVELFFPNGINLNVAALPNDNPTIHSTAHPLNDNDSNIGYIRYLEAVPDDSGEFHYTYSTILDQIDVNNGETIVVARPARNNMTLDGNCNYSEYSVEDFRNFLNQ